MPFRLAGGLSRGSSIGPTPNYRHKLDTQLDTQLDSVDAMRENPRDPDIGCC